MLFPATVVVTMLHKDADKDDTGGSDADTGGMSIQMKAVMYVMIEAITEMIEE